VSTRASLKSTLLLDVNVLIGLLDDESPFHRNAISWFKTVAAERQWATCPIVENGFIRIVSGTKYSNGKISPEEAQSTLAALKNFSSNHVFWADDISLCDSQMFDLELVQGSSQLTDLYLLGLCQKNKGLLATFDKRISTVGLTMPPKDLILLVK